MPAQDVRKLSSAVIAIVAVSLIAVNVALVIQNSRLKKRLEVSEPGLLPTVGTRIDRLSGASLDGKPLLIPFDELGSETLVFVFSAECHVCEINWPQWQKLEHFTEQRPIRKYL